MAFWAENTKPSIPGSVSGAPVEIDGGGDGGEWWGVVNNGGAVGWAARVIKRAGDGVLGQKNGNRAAMARFLVRRCK